MKETYSIFNVCAAAYDLLTAQDIWRSQIAQLLRYVPNKQFEMKVLDLGCGPGVSSFVLAEKLPKSHIVGIDYAHKMIACAHKRHQKSFSDLTNLEFIQADATKLPFADRSFDLVTGHSFLYLVSDRRKVLAEARRVMRPGAMIVLMEPNLRGSLVKASFSGCGHAREMLFKPIAGTRFATCMGLWRIFSSYKGKMSSELVQSLFQEAGLQKISCYPTLGGLGLHCVATA